MSNDIGSLVTSMLNGEPLHDAVTIGILIVVFYSFYTVMFQTLFGIFKK